MIAPTFSSHVEHNRWFNQPIQHDVSHTASSGKSVLMGTVFALNGIPRNVLLLS